MGAAPLGHGAIGSFGGRQESDGTALGGHQLTPEVAAQLIGMHRATLYRKMSGYGLDLDGHIF